MYWFVASIGPLFGCETMQLWACLGWESQFASALHFGVLMTWSGVSVSRSQCANVSEIDFEQ
jgi:purine-cytosine permease-like protein